MIEALKSDEIVDKLGGRFKLTTLVQRRWSELMQGARPLVEREGRSDMELAIEEVLQGKITLDFENSEVTPPEQALR
jgi:DNA-directed RNA polymerase subunit omega